MCLKELSIFAPAATNSDRAIHCALPSIIRLIKTAPSIPDVELHFHRYELSRIYNTDVRPLELSPLLDRLRSDFAGLICPRIDLHIYDVWGTRLNLTIPDTLRT
jgi:hypothetical protein